MESSIIAASIVGIATVAAAVVGSMKKKGDAAAISNVKASGPATVQTAPVSESNLAIGSNITQTYQASTHNYYGTTSMTAGPFHGKLASKPSLVEILDTIRLSKPYDKIQIAQNYVGVSISWPVVFSTMQRVEERDGWYVSFDSPDQHYSSVSAYIDIEKYPKLKVVDSGHPSWIEGKIEWVGSATVHLEANPEIILE